MFFIESSHQNFFGKQKNSENLDFQTTFLLQKRRSVTKNLVCNIFGITICSSRTYYTEVSAHVPQNVATKSSFKDKNTPKIYFYYLGTFLKQKGPKTLSWHHYTLSQAAYSLEIGQCVFTEISHQSSYREEKLVKVEIFRLRF